METAIQRVNEWIIQTEIDFNYSRVLNLSYLDLTQLPTLPINLRELYCNNNKLIELPSFDSLPNLYYINCNNNKLTSLCLLPKSLEVLTCEINELTHLPTLPNTLKKLICCCNKLIELPTLPEKLNELDFDFNLFYNRPKLPNSLYRLRVGSNQYKYSELEVLKLQDQIKILKQENNQLKQLQGQSFETVLSHTIRKYV